MREFASAALLVAGSFLVLLAALGVARFPDLYMRMQAASKAGIAGAGSMLFALCIYYGTLDVITRVLATIAFMFLSTPIGAHLLARAAYVAGVPRWERTVHDDFATRRSTAE